MLPILDLLLRSALSTILLAAALPKLARPRSFLLTVLSYELLPSVLAAPYALALPVVEFVAGVALAVGVAQRPAGIVAALMFLGFAIAVAANLARGRVMDCGCFGARQRKIGPGLVAQDLVLLTAAAAAARWGAEPSISSLSVLALVHSGQSRLLATAMVLV